MQLVPLPQRTELNLVSEKDQLFEQKQYPIPFEFNDQVAEVFDDMISRSVPFYREVNHTLVEWALLFQKRENLVFDIGCSTGTTIAQLSSKFEAPTQFVGIDTSEPMLAKAKQKLSSLKAIHQLTLSDKSALEMDFTGATLVVLNYTLQFISVGDRQKLLQKIYDGLTLGSMLFITEKVTSKSPLIQESMTFIHESFKVRNGYSKNEVSRKKEALDRVLIPISAEEHLENLELCGFKKKDIVLKWNNWVSIIAIKD